MKDDIVAVIVKIRFGGNSGVYPEKYLKDLKNDEWDGWGTPSRYKHLESGGKKLILYDPVRKALTAEVEITEVEFLKGNSDYPWRNKFDPGTVRVYRDPISVNQVRAVKGLENFSVYRKDRTSHRNVTNSQYLALHPGVVTSEAEIAAQQDKINSNDGYSPKTASEGRKKVLRSIALRRGQQRFRNNLLWAYQNRCCVTGTTSKEVLEAAHIQPYSELGTNAMKNGLLLRSDIHVLFDLNTLSINPINHTVFCSKRLRKNSAYASLHGKKAKLPKQKKLSPDSKLLSLHFNRTKS